MVAWTWGYPLFRLVETIDVRPVDHIDVMGQGPVATIDVLVCGKPLIQRAYLCDFSEDPCQLHVCDCGVIGCNLQDYALLRQLGGRLLVIPTFVAMSGADPGLPYESAPPSCVIGEGYAGLVFGPDAYASLRKAVAGFPAIDEVPPATLSELAACLTASAPERLLGRNPLDPCLNDDLVIALVNGELAAWLPAVKDLFRSMADDDRAASLSSSDGESLGMILDAAGFPIWDAFVRVGDEVGVHIPYVGTVIVPGPVDRSKSVTR